MAIKANPNKSIDKLLVLPQVAESLHVDAELAIATFYHVRKNEYLQMIAAHSDKFPQLNTPDPAVDEFFDIFAEDYYYAPQDNVKMKDQKCLDVPGWCDLNMELYTAFAGSKENAISRFVRLMKQKSDISRKTLENCRSSLLDLAVKIYKKQGKQTE